MTFQHISPAELKDMMAREAVTVIDIRDPGSYKDGHIEGALHVDDGNVEDFVAGADKSKPLVVCCYHGNSSQGAAQYMVEHGFSRAYSLDGGYATWVP